MTYELPLRNRATPAGIAIGLIGLLLVVVGCASWKMERVSVPTEAKSSGGIEVTPPRVYRDADGFLVAGNLRGQGIGAHHPGQGRLREARAEVAAAEARSRMTQNELTTRLRESHLQLTTALATSAWRSFCRCAAIGRRFS